MKHILSIQSHVTYGHVGNSAAVFPLQYLGNEVWPLHTVQFSGQTQYPHWDGDVFSEEHLRKIIKGVFSHVSMKTCDAILAGYLGSKSTGDVVYDTVNAIKKENPNAIFCCDPVMGDVDSGFYISEDVPPLYKEKILTIADMITPNHFETEYLVNGKISTLDEAKTAAKTLYDKGPNLVFITSLIVDETPNNHFTILLFDGNEYYIINNPLIDMGDVCGTGDVFAALTLAHTLQGQNPVSAMERTVSSMYSLLENTNKLKQFELDLIGSREVFSKEEILFKAINI
ncbi:pyridoxal kinase PdxY [Flammeovirga agarivorans]|uniref:pyridoxal kinase n=1 Tax=Flammeovirga agarivorans TaxID=2726742 RepID=A0A7X8XWD6_9BACT|nr:pyridoxal kinase PdxY [Flammeovirga agarivorans]NLR91985.1 pyridoxal kinase PdxY [Flammeovirga agarivorans]